MFRFSLFMTLVLTGLYACKDDRSNSIEHQSESDKEVIVDLEQISMAVIPDKSIINWSCYKPGTTHHGRMKIHAGTVKLSSRKVLDADVVVSMNSLRVDDLEGEDKEKLERHLKGLDKVRAEDFFNIRKYPYSEFSLNRVVNLMNDAEYNSLVYGNLTMKDITKEIAFKANIERRGSELIFGSEEFSINRTDWGINFMSKSIFDDLKDEFIADEVKLQIELVASADL